MKIFKKVIVMITVVLVIGLVPLTAFAASTPPSTQVARGAFANKGTRYTATRVRQKDCTYSATGTRQGGGACGSGQLKGIGGKGLQDGSCYLP